MSSVQRLSDRLSRPGPRADWTPLQSTTTASYGCPPHTLVATAPRPRPPPPAARHASGLDRAVIINRARLPPRDMMREQGVRRPLGCRRRIRLVAWRRSYIKWWRERANRSLALRPLAGSSAESNGDPCSTPFCTTGMRICELRCAPRPPPIPSHHPPTASPTTAGVMAAAAVVVGIMAYYRCRDQALKKAPPPFPHSTTVPRPSLAGCMGHQRTITTMEQARQALPASLLCTSTRTGYSAHGNPILPYPCPDSPPRSTGCRRAYDGPITSYLDSLTPHLGGVSLRLLNPR